MGLLSHAGQGRFETVHEENMYEDYIRIFRDQQTGVNYLGINSGAGFALTPLLDKDGKVVVTKEAEEE